MCAFGCTCVTVRVRACGTMCVCVCVSSYVCLWCLPGQCVCAPVCVWVYHRVSVSMRAGLCVCACASAAVSVSVSMSVSASGPVCISVCEPSLIAIKQVSMVSSISVTYTCTCDFTCAQTRGA